MSAHQSPKHNVPNPHAKGISTVSIGVLLNITCTEATMTATHQIPHTFEAAIKVPSAFFLQALRLPGAVSLPVTSAVNRKPIRRDDEGDGPA
jgi:hypothetical protein